MGIRAGAIPGPRLSSCWSWAWWGCWEKEGGWSRDRVAVGVIVRQVCLSSRTIFSGASSQGLPASRRFLGEKEKPGRTPGILEQGGQNLDPNHTRFALSSADWERMLWACLRDCVWSIFDASGRASCRLKRMAGFFWARMPRERSCCLRRFARNLRA